MPDPVQPSDPQPEPERSSSFRLRRMARFLELFAPDRTQPILDAGGSPEQWIDIGYDGPIVFLNVQRDDDWPDLPPGCTFLEGDGRAMPFADGEFDIVFSNSVIEHVGDLDDQRRFATEVRRVGRRWWVQAPNRRFLIEPHVRFPGYQWLPSPLQHAVVASWPFIHHRHDHLTTDEAWAAMRGTRLPTVGEMRDHFPDGVIWRERAFGLTKSIVAYRR